MFVLTTFVLLATCNLSASIGVHNKEHGRLLTDFRNGEFLQNMRDWFLQFKNQLHERVFGEASTTTTPTFSPADTLNLDKFDFQRRVRNREWPLLNLSTISFDPKQDWGFRAGNWYFIRKVSKDQNKLNDNSDESGFLHPSTTQPKDSTKAETEETLDIKNDTSSTSTVAYQIDSETTLSPSVEEDSLFESSSPDTEKNLEDNETVENSPQGSTEVLMG